MIKTISFFLLFLCFCRFEGISQQAQWAKWFAGNDASKGVGVRADTQGNVYTIGSYSYFVLSQSGPVDFDPGPAVNGITPNTNGTSGFISKLNAQGNFVWARPFALNDIGGVDLQTLTLDAQGNLIIAGRFGGTVDFNLGPGVFNVTSGPAVGDSMVANLFVASYAPSGNFLWVKTFPCMALDIVPNYPVVNSVSGLALDSDQNILLSLNFRGRIDLDPGSNAVWKECGGLNYNSVIVKLDHQGNYIWGQHFSGSFNTSGTLATDAQSNIYVQGGMMGAVDFDPSTGENWIANYSFNDSYVLKMSPLGEVSWINKIHGPYAGYGGCLGITTDREGNVLATGGIRDSLYFRSASDSLLLLKSNAYVDSGGNGFVTKINPDGHFLWIKQQASNSTLGVSGNKIQCDSLNNVYVCGTLSDSADFDYSGNGDILYARGDNSTFLMKLDKDGNYIRTSIIDGDRYVNCFDFSLDRQANMYFTGLFSVVNLDPGMPWATVDGTGQIDFDPGPDTLALIGDGRGIETVFVAKWSQCSTGSDTLNETACNSFTWQGENLTASGIYRKSLTTNERCDSIVVLNLILNTSTEAEQNLRICAGESITVGNQTFTNSGTYIQTLSNQAGCDSVLTTHLVVDTVHAEISLTENVFAAINPPMEASFQWLNCEENFAPINGETNSEFIAQMDGNYALETIAEGCRDTSDCLFFSSVGVNLITSNHLNIYPIPANETLIVESEKSNLPIRIFDAQGRLVFETIKSEKHMEIDLRLFQSGLYFIQSEKTSQPFTIIRNR
jgi:hypothetical protein